MDGKIGPAAKSEKRLSFLCSRHRDWVYFNSQEALENLDQTQFKGEILMENFKWLEAVPHFGCAWEITEILLQLNVGDKSILVRRFVSLTILLNICLERIGQQECARSVCSQTLSAMKVMLMQMDKTSENSKYIVHSIEQLKHPENFHLYLRSLSESASNNTVH